MIIPRNRRLAQEHAPEVRKTQEKEDDAVVAGPFYNLFLTNIVSSFSLTGSITEYLVDSMPAKELRALDKDSLRFVQQGGEFPSLLAESIDLASDPNISARESFLTCVREEARQSVYPKFSELVDLLINSYISQDEAIHLLKNMIDLCFPSFNTTTREQPRLKHVTRIFGLNEKEIDLIMYYYCSNHDHGFDTLCDFQRTTKEYLSIAAVVGITVGELHTLLSGKGNLRRQSIIIARQGWGGQSVPEIDAGIDDYLSGIASKPFRARIERLPQARFKLDSFSMKEECLTILQSIIKRKEAKHILIYGTPGAGKTEFVKTLVESSGKTAYSLKMGDASQTRSDRLVALSAAARATEADGSILVVDECDNLLCTESRSNIGGNTRNQGKEWLNFFLDSIKIPTIWITNSIDGIHPSVKRRFSFAEHFASLPMDNRLSIWANLCDEHGVPELQADESCVGIVRKYLPSPAEMESAIKVVKEEPLDIRIKQIETILEAKKNLVMGKMKTKKSLLGVTEAYDEQAVNCDTSPDLLINAVKRAIEYGKPLNILFHGVPGSGKTELVKYIATRSARELMVQRASDILSPYVGVAEQNIATIFKTAEREKSILLLDEADSFFQDRKNAHHSWEVAQVNEFLTQMENFQGVLFACTNLIEKLDTATLRRFAWKIKFSPLDNKQKHLLFDKWFPGVSLDPDASTLLERTEGICPGDFKTVHSRLWLYGKLDIVNLGITPLEIISELSKEAFYRQAMNGSANRIGFGV